MKNFTMLILPLCVDSCNVPKYNEGGIRMASRGNPPLIFRLFNTPDADAPDSDEDATAAGPSSFLRLSITSLQGF